MVIIRTFKYKAPLIITEGGFKGCIGRLFSTFYGDLDLGERFFSIEINIDNIVGVKSHQVTPFDSANELVKKGINIRNQDGSYRTAYEIIRDMEERNMMNNEAYRGLLNAMHLNVDKLNIAPELKETIADVEIIVPDKVVEVTFDDGLKEKMILHKEDTFNLRNCLFIAIAKHLYKKEFTSEGLEWKAFELTHLKKYVKIVDTALKNYERKQKEIAMLEEKRKADQERLERKRAKRQVYKERRATKREELEKEKQIEIQKEAYIRAMECVKDKTV